MDEVTVDIEGYGIVTIDLPKNYDKDSFCDGVAEAVRQTMSLVDVRDTRFHPAIGFYGTKESKSD